MINRYYIIKSYKDIIIFFIMDNKREELIKLLQQNNIYNYTLTQHIIDLFKNKEKKIHKICENRCLALTNNGFQCTRQQKI